MNKLLYRLKDIFKAMWFRCLLYCLFALAAFFIGPIFEDSVPDKIKKIVTQEGLINILKILASSMLAVTIFSLSIMVQAFSAAAITATPRANKLLMEDSTAQNALGTFIGAFLFSIVGIIGINANFYAEGIIVVLFIFTVIMIVIIIFMLLKWIDQLSKLGRVTETINLVDRALDEALKKRGKNPFLQANELKHSEDALKEKMYPILVDTVGYVQFIDIKNIEKIACENGFNVYFTANPGKFLDSTEPFAFVDKESSEEMKKCICDSVIIGGNRTFEQDPRYGFIVLSEIALRALSPGINDPGTAIDVIGSYIQGITMWDTIFKPGDGNSKKINGKVKYPHVFIPRISEDDIFEDMYNGLMPAAAEHIMVSIRLKKSLLTFKKLNNEKLFDCADFWLKHLEYLCEKELNEKDYMKFYEVS